MKPLNILFILILSPILAACGSNSVIVTNQTDAQPTPVSLTLTPVVPTGELEAQQPQSSGAGALRALQLPELTDNQGAVAVTVKPLDLSIQAEKLLFEVALETHSVDLSMDLAALSTLTTDTGLTVQSDVWDAPRGGHHVSGTLSFPSSVEGKPILDGASKLTLAIKDVDAPERIFAWDLK
jgi:hypothetical protein